MWLGSTHQMANVNVLEVPVASTRISVSETARDLVVVIDSQLSQSAQVAAVCRSGYGSSDTLVRSTSAEAVKTLFQAFITRRLDYCNSLVYGITVVFTEGLMSRLQSVQNAAARLVSGARRYDRITLVLQELHWLPVRRRVDFRMTTLVYIRQSLSGMAPAYLAADCQLVSVLFDDSRRQLRCVTPKTGRALSDGPTATMETSVLQLQVRSCGTAFQLICDKLTLTFNDLSGY